MTSAERINEAKEKAKESAKQIFKEKPNDIQKEFEEETVLGNPENLVKPENENE
jgi:hypothetical protein